MNWDWLGPVIQLAGDTANTISQAVTNKKNREFQMEQNEITRQREDTAHQREVADLQAAGLSPLAATGGAPTSTPLASEAEAPTMDMASMADAVATMQTLDIQRKQLEFEKEKHRDELSEGEKERGLRREEISKQEEMNNKNIDSAQKIANKQLAGQLLQICSENKRHTQTIKHQVEMNTQQNRRQTAESSEERYKSMCQTLGVRLSYKEYTNIDEYIEANAKFEEAWTGFMNWLGNENDGEEDEENLYKEPPTGRSKNNSWDRSASAGLLGATAGTSESSSGSYSWSAKEDVKRSYRLSKLWQQYKEKEEIGKDVECPIYVHK